MTTKAKRKGKARGMVTGYAYVYRMHGMGDGEVCAMISVPCYSLCPLEATTEKP